MAYLGKDINLLLGAENTLVGPIINVLYRYFDGSRLAWQIWIVLLRLATSLGFLRILRLLWPKNPVVTFVMALLFAVYPGFTQLSSALTYSTYYLAFGAALFSIWLSLIAIDYRSTAVKAALIVAAVLLALGYLRTYPFMIGFEGVRFLLIGYRYYQRRKAFVRGWALKTLKVWLPYTLPLLAMAYWRFVSFPGTVAKSDLGLLRDLLSRDFFGGLGLLLGRAAGDFVKAVGGAWILPLWRGIVNGVPGEWVFAGALGIVALSIAWIALSMLDSYSESEKSVVKSPTRLLEVAIVGALWTLCTILPVTLITQYIDFYTPLDRYALHTAGGAVILLVALLMLIVRNRRVQQVVIALLVFAGVVSLVLSSFYHLNLWREQRTAWWQFYWHAPDLREDTALVLQLPQKYALAEGYEIWAPANLLYQKNSADLYIQGEVLNDETVESIANQQTLVKVLPPLTIQSNYANGLVASLQENGCLHLYEQGWYVPYGSAGALTKQAATVSKTAQILTAMPVRPPTRSTFGREPTHDWCYYYQKASYAVQHQEWLVIQGYWNQIRAEEMAPDPGYELEWLPMYEGLINLRFHIDAATVASRIKANPAAVSDFCAPFSASPEAISALSPERQTIVRELCSE